ncbi:ankyrin repeat domain-containing protein [Peribacillus sp. V2I11]|uniref:ankyrin repeat domain-containing protein n=1 Tax=Peribacillus sp. V2I11 TaxID=3042277 RepID=UPI002787ACB0|nr:ankyrin repeat domain-containing protein [Peribacillus sp. V2I11]MDQ0882400.1 ankyrin repeat protein [Peribacillus sp. V2I11]
MDKIQIAKDIRGAIKSGQLDMVKDLLEREPEMLTWMIPFGTWLHIAAAYGHLKIIEYLINAGIDTNAQGGTFSTNALERAATKGHLDIPEYLINQNVEMDTSEPDRNPLFAAIYGGYFEIVKLLVEKNIDISIKYSGDNMKDIDAHAFAIERGQTEIAEYLKEKWTEGDSKLVYEKLMKAKGCNSQN